MGRVQLSCTVFRLQNSRFFSFKGGKRRKHGFARAKREREPHTPAGRVKARKKFFVFFQHLSPVPLSVFTLGPDLSIEDRAYPYNKLTQKYDCFAVYTVLIFTRHQSTNWCQAFSIF